MPNGNSPSGEAVQMPAFATSKQGLGREARAALLIVRTGPECPKDNLRELTSDSKPDCGIATPGKTLHCQAHSQNKGLTRASWLRTGPSPSGDRQPEPEGGNHSPRETLSTKLQAGFFAN